ncbi:MAG: MFS transporter [Actinomycetota bacterium]|nr:MFS transporter [Actinomycetota bacterium]
MASSLRRALRRSDFRRLFLAQTISRWGDTFNYVALVILVFRLTGSGLKVAAIVAFEIVPVLLLGFVAGAVVDRFPRRTVMVISDVGRAAIAFALAASHEQLAFVYVAAFALASFSVFFNPAASSVVPSLVDEDEVVGANSALWSAAVISQIVLAPAAGGLVALAGPGWAFAINGATFLISALFLMKLSIERVPSVAARTLSEILEGLRVLRRSRFLRTLGAVQALAALSTGATSALLVVLAQQHLGVGAARFGFLLTAIGLGAALGPLVLQRVATEVRRPLLLFGPYLLRGAVDLVLAAFSSFTTAVGALFFYGIGTSTGNVTYNTALQKNVPDRLRGRVFAFYDVVWQSTRLVSLGLGGFVADRIGITSVYVLGGALLIAAAVFGFAAMPREAMTETVS